MTARPHRIERAFTMTEVLMALSLLVIFFAAAGEVFRSTVLLSWDGPQSSNRASQIDSSLFQLRRDVWNSQRISVSKTTSVDLESDAGKISWTIDPDGNLIRTDPRGQTEQWKLIGKTWSLAADPTCLTIRDGSDEMRLPSQILLARGAQP